MTLYIPKPGTWFLPFLPVRCIERYPTLQSGLFSGWTWQGWRVRGDEEICPIDEFWVITLMDNDQIRQQIIAEMAKMWYWNGIIIVWFLSTFAFIITGLSHYTYAATWAALVWALTQIAIRIGILIHWRRAVHDS